MNALGIVILSHILSRISRPESGDAIAFTTVAMSVLIVKFRSSNPEKHNHANTVVRNELFFYTNQDLS